MLISTENTDDVESVNYAIAHVFAESMLKQIIIVRRKPEMNGKNKINKSVGFKKT